MQLIQIGTPAKIPVAKTIREMFLEMAHREHQMVLAARQAAPVQSKSIAPEFN